MALIKTKTSKWNEPTFGIDGNGFWVVAICEQKVIYYNDKEDGFNISNYFIYSQIDGYYCNQDDLSRVLDECLIWLNLADK